MSTAAKGRRFEYVVRDHFREEGAFVSRAAKSNFPDLIVIWPAPSNRVAMVECKAGTEKSFKRSFAAEKAQLVELARRFNCVAIWAEPDGVLTKIKLTHL